MPDRRSAFIPLAWVSFPLYFLYIYSLYHEHSGSYWPAAARQVREAFFYREPLPALRRPLTPLIHSHQFRKLVCQSL